MRNKDTPHNKTRGRSLQWECVEDPTQDKVFLGNFFRTTDITGYGGGFPPGTVFKNTKTGKMIAQ